MTAACTAPRHDDEPVPAAPHAALCRSCTSRLHSGLRILPALHAALADALDPRRPAGPRGGDGDGLPYNEPAAEAASQIRHDAEHWTMRVLVQRQPGICPVRTVAAMCGWLAGQVEWISYQPWAGDMAGAVAGCRGGALRVLDPVPRSEIAIPPDVNWCPSCEATGSLGAVIAVDERDRRPSLVWCSACERTWDATQWLRLGQVIVRHRAEHRAVFGAVA